MVIGSSANAEFWAGKCLNKDIMELSEMKEIV